MKKNWSRQVHNIQISITLLALILLFYIIAWIRIFQGNELLINNFKDIILTIEELNSHNQTKATEAVLLEALDNQHSKFQRMLEQYPLEQLYDVPLYKELKNLSRNWNETKNLYTITLETNANNVLVIQTYSEHLNVLYQATQSYATQVINKLANLEIYMSFVVFLLILSGIIQYYFKKEFISLKEQAFLDVTTIPNRTCCINTIDNYDAKENCFGCGCIMFDLNNLKVTNDTYGHKAGDELIHNFASILKNSISEYGFVGRFGGDEFISIFENCNETSLDSYIKDIQKDVECYNKKHEYRKISYSYGFAVSNKDNYYNMSQLVQSADKSMYTCKRCFKCMDGNV